MYSLDRINVDAKKAARLLGLVFIGLVIYQVFIGARISGTGITGTGDMVYRTGWTIWKDGNYHATEGRNSTQLDDVHLGDLFATVINAASDGDSIYISAGDYSLEKMVTVDKAVVISSGGYAVTITATASMDAMFKATVSYVKIKDITLDADNKAIRCIWINGGSRCEMTAVDAENAVTNCFEVSYTSQKTGNKFDRCIGGGGGFSDIYIGKDQTDSWVTGCTLKDDYSGTDAGLALDGDGSQIMNNHMWGNKYGIWLAPNSTITKTSIIGNYIEGNTDANIYAGGVGHSVWDIVISSNVFWSNAADRPEYDILLDPQNIDGTQYWANRNTIIGNSFVGQSTYADYGIYFGTYSQANTVIGNTFNGFHVAAIDGTSGLAEQLIKGNAGYVTEMHGNAVILNGTASVVITHNLGYVPALADFSVSYVEYVDPGDFQQGAFYWTDATTTTVTLHVTHALTTEDASVVWRYDRTKYGP